MSGIRHMMMGMGGFNPDTRMNLINLQSHNTAGMTIGAGNRISAWSDALGNSLTQGTDSARPTLTGGVPLFDGGDTLARASDKSLGSVFSLYAIFKNTGTLSKIPFSSMAVNDYGMHAALYEFNLIGSASGAGGFGSKAGLGLNKRYSILSIRRNGNATAKVKVNDRDLILTGTSFHASNATVLGKLGDRAAGGFAFTGGIMALCAGDQCLSDALNIQQVNALYTRYGLAALNTPDIVTGFGDSNTTGQGSVSYLVGLSTLMGLGYLNLGISGTLFTNVGATANNGYGRWTSQIISKPYNDYLVVQYGTNELGTSAAIYGAQLDEKVAEHIAAGYSPSKICLVSNPYKQFGADAALLDTRKTTIENIAIARGTKFFDFLGWMRLNGADTLMVDAAHVNQTAQDGMMNGVYTAFTS